MPTIITLPPAGAPFGPGFQLNIHSDTVGPFLPPLEWEVTWTPDNTHDSEGSISAYSTEDPHNPIIKFFPEQGVVLPVTPHATQGTDGTLLARLVQQGVELERSSVPVKADWQTGALFQLGQRGQQGGALTPIQAQQLQEVHGQTFLSTALDALTLSEITNGPQGGFVAAQLALWIFGVLVRIATVPPEYRVDTADGDYWVRSLAVVRIYRGSDVWKRVPIHTSSKLISFVEEGLVVAISSLTMTQWLTQISVQVSFAPGVTGQVFLMRAP